MNSRGRTALAVLALLAVAAFAAADEAPLRLAPPPELDLRITSPLTDRTPERAPVTPPLRLEDAAPPAPVLAQAAPQPEPALPPEPAAPAEPSPYMQRVYGEAADATVETRDGGGGDSMFLAGLRTFAWLCVLCAVIILGGYAIRRYGQHTPLLSGQRLGNVLGRIHLNPKTSLHFVKTGGRVLVIGVTPQQVSLLTEFEAAAFDALSPEADVLAERAAAAEPASDFLHELRANNYRLEEPALTDGDDDLVSLRTDIQRLQRAMQEKLREARE